MDIDPPAHDSPKNILNILDDDCIEHILRQLTPSVRMEDLLNATETCIRFQETAKRLKSAFKSIVIENTCGISTQRLPVLLENFNHLIEEIKWHTGWTGNEPNDEIFKLIVKYCGKTLRKLTIWSYNPTFNEQNRFQALEDLTLLNAQPKDFHLESPLKYLTIRSYSFHNQQWFMRPFPELMEIDFGNDQQFTDGILTEFLLLNPQLRSLTTDCDQLSPMILQNIAAHSPNLESLNLRIMDFNTVAINSQLQRLKGFRKLRKFYFHNEVSLEALLVMVAENKVPIEDLFVIDMPINATPKFPFNDTLVHLILEVPKCSLISDDYLINLIKSLTVLRSLHICHYDRAITTRRIEKILECGKSLTKFAYFSIWTEITLENYNRILRLAQNRVKVILNYYNLKVFVPKNVLKANRKWVIINPLLRLGTGKEF